MMNVLRSRYFQTVLHVSIWLVLLAIPTILLWKQSWMGLTQTFFFLNTLYHIGFFYFNAYFLYPRLLTRKWWWLYILCISAFIHVSYYAKILLLKLTDDFVLTTHNSKLIFFSIFPFIFASIIFRLINDRLRFERLEKEERAQRLDAELKFLRSQVSPHFLFNMMTNLVSLARQRSELLEPSLIRLSDLLRYMLYDSKEEKILIGREIDNIQNYVSLQLLRFGDDVRITLDVINDCEEGLVEPMLLIPFIENSFKHGTGIIEDPFIDITVNVSGRQLVFHVSNRFVPGDQAKDKDSGIGLRNVKSRLQLLYPGKYDLSISEKNNLFSVQLKLDLA